MINKLSNIPILYIIYILNLVFPLQAMQKSPKGLKLLAGQTLAKNIKSIRALPMPEECQKYLGLIKIQEVTSQTEIIESIGGSNIDDIEHLDITYTEYFTNKTFEQLIDTKNKQNLPFILAIATTIQDGIIKHTYYDALSLNKYLKDTYQTINLSEDKDFFDPILNFTIKKIQYFTIDSNFDSQAIAIGTDLDWIRLSKANEFINGFFQANEGKIYAQHEVGHFYKKNNIKQAIRYYTLAADKGDTDAQNNLANIYLKLKNIELAKHYYMLAIKHDNASSINNSIYNYNLGLLYETNEENTEQAKIFYTISALKGYIDAQCRLASIYEDEGDIKKAKHFYTIAAIKGHTAAQNNLGMIYHKENNIPQAKHFYTLAADQGCKFAQFNLAIIYKKENNIEKAKYYYALSADQGHKKAQFNLGKLYEQKNNIKEAKRYYTLAADQGHIIAQFSLGYIYNNENNIKAAKKYYMLAASQGDSDAQFDLGIIYEKENDLEQAKYFYILAASQSDAKAQNNLAALFGQEGDIEQAKIYFTLAADQGHKKAQFNLGKLYEREGNIKQAIHYYTLAADQEYTEAEFNLGQLHQRLANNYFALAASKGHIQAKNKLHRKK